MSALPKIAFHQYVRKTSKRFVIFSLFFSFFFLAFFFVFLAFLFMFFYVPTHNVHPEGNPHRQGENSTKKCPSQASVQIQSLPNNYTSMQPIINFNLYIFKVRLEVLVFLSLFFVICFTNVGRDMLDAEHYKAASHLSEGAEPPILTQPFVCARVIITQD